MAAAAPPVGACKPEVHAAAQVPSVSTLAPWDEGEVSVGHVDSIGSVGSTGSFGWQPQALQHFFNVADVERWDAGRFAMVRTIQGAPRNKGEVCHMVDTTSGAQVAVKRMPADWTCECHATFSAKYPHETERPWVDIGCSAFLTDVAYPYVCPLLGVYRDEESTRVVTELASGGDLFAWARNCEYEPGLQREAAVLPLARQIFDAVRMLHDLGIVHRDVSAENLLLSRSTSSAFRTPLKIQLIDFGMSTISRFAPAGDRGKPTYQAPEAHSGEAFDGFLADAFATGVVLYGLLALEYPWSSTKPGGCKAFEHLKAHGFRALAAKRKSFRKTTKVADHMSEPLLQLLEGLLTVNPSDRLTLGECTCFDGDDRKSVWQEPWAQGALQ